MEGEAFEQAADDVAVLCAPRLESVLEQAPDEAVSQRSAHGVHRKDGCEAPQNCSSNLHGRTGRMLSLLLGTLTAHPGMACVKKASLCKAKMTVF